MPIHTGKDSNGLFVQWGNQKKYYYNSNDKQSFEKAKEKARKQMIAIYASGYHENIQYNNKFNILFEQLMNDIIDDDAEFELKISKEDFNKLPDVLYTYCEENQLDKIKQYGFGEYVDTFHFKKGFKFYLTNQNLDLKDKVIIQLKKNDLDINNIYYDQSNSYVDSYILLIGGKDWGNYNDYVDAYDNPESYWNDNYKNFTFFHQGKINNFKILGYKI